MMNTFTRLSPGYDLTSGKTKNERWPVLGAREWSFGPVAWFDSYGEALAYINANIDNGTLFIGDPVEQLTECVGDPLLRRVR